MPVDTIDRFADLIFLAKLTGRATDSLDDYRYAWIEQQVTAAGDYEDAATARYGTTAVNYAREINDKAVDVTGNPFVWMRFRSLKDGTPIYEFESGHRVVSIARVTSGTVNADGNYPGVLTQWNAITSAWVDGAVIAIKSSNGDTLTNATRYQVVYQSDTSGGSKVWATDKIGAGGTSLTVESVDGGYTQSTTTLRLDTADAISLSNPSAGVTRVDVRDASRTSNGIVSVGNQEFRGSKTVLGDLTVHNIDSVPNRSRISMGPNDVVHLEGAGDAFDTKFVIQFRDLASNYLGNVTAYRDSFQTDLSVNWGSEPVGGTAEFGSIRLTASPNFMYFSMGANTSGSNNSAVVIGTSNNSVGFIDTYLRLGNTGYNGVTTLPMTGPRYVAGWYVGGGTTGVIS